jgi:hypothetical protein
VREKEIEWGAKLEEGGKIEEQTRHDEEEVVQ